MQILKYKFTFKLRYKKILHRQNFFGAINFIYNLLVILLIILFSSNQRVKLFKGDVSLKDITGLKNFEEKS